MNRCMFDKLRNKWKEIGRDGVTIPIKPVMLEQLIKRQPELKDIKVEISSENLVIRGTTEMKKGLIRKNIAFEVALKPIHMEKRIILFELIRVKPVDINMINSRLFHKPPFAQYSERTVKIDFNSWDIVKKVPVGHIKSYEMTNGAINLTLSF